MPAGALAAKAAGRDGWSTSVDRLTFNAWALEGYQKVFWYDVPVRNLLPQVVVLLVSCLSFLLLARWLIGQRIEA